MRIFHTSDVHVGMRFTRGYPDTVRDSLVKARVEVVSRMVELANREQCDLFAIAGDLFDNLKVSKTAIRETAHALKRFEGLVAVLPGNHDYLQEANDPIWPTFADQLGDDHLVLKDRRPYDLGPFELPCVLYPGVCCSKHSKENAIGWVPEATAEEDSDKVRVGIAHGSLAGLSPDFDGDYFPMTSEELKRSGVHVWLLGHTHIRYPDREQGNRSHHLLSLGAGAGRIRLPTPWLRMDYRCEPPREDWLRFNTNRQISIWADG